MAIKLPRIPSGFKIINRDGTATNEFQLWWAQVADQVENQFNSIELALAAAGIALDAAAAAQAAADAANAAASDAQDAADDATAATESLASEQSLQASGVINESGQLQANTIGTVTIANHDRAYGNATLNPTVSVIGDTLAGAGSSGDVVYIYYDDPTRAGGSVTYQTSTDPEDAKQSGNRHSVGSILIPSVGTGFGAYVRPSGIPA